MELTIDDLKIGDYVKVKEGILDPDFSSQLIGGWQGKVTGIQGEAKLVDIEWDMETLYNIPMKYLCDVISGGYEYSLMTLEIGDLERASNREATVTEEMEKELATRIYWIEVFDDQFLAEAYIDVFKDVDINDRLALYKRWKEYLNEHLEFPIMTEIVEGRREGRKLKLLNLGAYKSMVGILGQGAYRREIITIPIDNLEVIDEESKSYAVLSSYVYWFVNT